MSIEMGEWVIDKTLTQISQWKKMALGFPIFTSTDIGAVKWQ